MEVRQRLLFNDSILSDTKEEVDGEGCTTNGGGTRHLVLVERPGKLKTDPATKMCVVLPRVFIDVEVYAAITSSSSSHNPDGDTASKTNHHHVPPSSATTTPSQTPTTTTATKPTSSPSPPRSAVCTFARGGGIERIAVNSLTREERRVLHIFIRKALRCLRPAALKIVCSLVVDSVGVIRALHEAVLAEQKQHHHQQQHTTTALSVSSADGGGGGGGGGKPDALVPEMLLVSSSASRRKKNASPHSEESPPPSPQQFIEGDGAGSNTQQPPSPSPPHVARTQLPFYISMTGRRIPLPPGVSAADLLLQQHHIKAGTSPRASVNGGARVGAGYAVGRGGFRRGSRDRTGAGGGGDLSPSYGSAAHSFFGADSLNQGVLKARVGSRGKGGQAMSFSRHTPVSSSLIYSSRSDKLLLSVAGNADGDASVIIDDGVDWLTSAQFGGQQLMTPRGRSASTSISPSNSLQTSVNRAPPSKHHHRLPAPPSRTPSPMTRKLTTTTVAGGGGRVHKPFAESSTTESTTSLSGSEGAYATTARGGDFGAIITAAAAAQSGNTINSTTGPAGSSSVGKQTFGTPIIVTTSTSLSSYGHGVLGGGMGGESGGEFLQSGSEGSTPSGSSAEHSIGRFTTTTASATTPSASQGPLRAVTTNAVSGGGGGAMSQQQFATGNAMKPARSLLGTSNISASGDLGGLQMSGLQNAVSEGTFSSNSVQSNSHHQHHPHMPHTSPGSSIRGGRAGSLNSGLLPTTPEVRGGLPGGGGGGGGGGPPSHRVPDARLMVIDGVDIANVVSPDSRSMHVTPMASPLDVNGSQNYNSNNTGRHLFNSNNINQHQHGGSYINPLAGRSTSNSRSSHPISPRHDRRPQGEFLRSGRNGSVDSGDVDGPVLNSVPSSASVYHTNSLLDNFSAAMVLKSAPSTSSLRTTSGRLPDRLGSQAYMLGGDNDKDHYLSPKASGARLLARRPQTQDTGSRLRLHLSNNSSHSPHRGDSQRSMSLVQPLSATSDAGDTQLNNGGNGASPSPPLFPTIPLQSSSSARVSGGSSKHLERR